MPIDQNIRALKSANL